MDNNAIDRRLNAGVTQPLKTSRWPRTSRRQERIEQALSRRQPDLTVVLEDVHDAHNVSAVLRSCDAVGILRVHIVYAEETPPAKAFARTSSGSAAKWITMERHDSIETCYAALRAGGLRILTTAFEPGSTDLYETDLTQPVALVFGNEMRGASQAAIRGADGLSFIPMMGMIQSLNISVACAVTLYEALRQRRATGHYRDSKLPDDALTTLRDDWLKR